MAHYDYHNNYVSMTDMFYESHKSVIEKVCLHLEVDPNSIDEIVLKFLGKPQKVKSIRDPELPKRPKSAYLLFCKEARSKVKEELPNARLPEIAKKLGQLWAKCDGDEKKKFEDQSKEDKQRYLEDMEKYKQERIY